MLSAMTMVSAGMVAKVMWITQASSASRLIIKWCLKTALSAHMFDASHSNSVSIYSSTCVIDIEIFLTAVLTNIQLPISQE